MMSSIQVTVAVETNYLTQHIFENFNTRALCLLILVAKVLLEKMLDGGIQIDPPPLG